MLKLLPSIALAALAFAGFAGVGQAAVHGPHAAACTGGNGPAMLVEVKGLKSRTGTIRVQSYGGQTSSFFEKGRYLERIDVPTPRSGSVEICVPVPAGGVYAVSVRHDANGNGKSDKADGGGMSGNPSVSLLDVVFKRKPAPREVAIQVGQGVTPVPVVMNYVQGGAFKPLSAS